MTLFKSKALNAELSRKLEEFSGRRKGDRHRDLVKKARTLQRQMEKLSPLHLVCGHPHRKIDLS